MADILQYIILSNINGLYFTKFTIYFIKIGFILLNLQYIR